MFLASKNFLKFVKEKAKTNKVVVICGGGTQISEELVKAGYNIRYNKFGRITRTNEEKDIIKKVLARQKASLKKIFKNKNVKIIIPILKVETVECNINADNLVKAYYLGFNKIYILTLKDRVKSKRNYFKDYPKVNIIEI